MADSTRSEARSVAVLRTCWANSDTGRLEGSRPLSDRNRATGSSLGAAAEALAAGDTPARWASAGCGRRWLLRRKTQARRALRAGVGAGRGGGGPGAAGGGGGWGRAGVAGVGGACRPVNLGI